MNAVPLIVIVVVTAVKDAIEDWRRTVLDNELNNSPVYRLVDWNNVNSTEDNVSLWRRFKKACTRAVIFTYRKIKSIRRKEAPNVMDDDRRGSLVTNRQSIYSHRASYYSTAGDHETDGNAIQMTPVPSPNPNAQRSQQEGWPDSAADVVNNGYLQPGKSVRDSVAPGPKKAGSILDRSKQTPEKARFKRDYWKSIQVGDFVRLYNGDQIPADIVILSSSDPDGACYVETKNLDGETNLKVRQALHCGRQVKHARDCEKAEFIIESEPPHPNLYSYNGAIRWEQRNEKYPEAPRQEMVEPITINNMLLRGCTLQNTEWVLGVVVFTGSETKIMLNSGVTPSKRPRMARELNWNVIYNFIILFIMCLLSGLINGFAWGASNGSLQYFEYGSYGGSPAVEGIVAFWVAVILFQNLVPISLYISLEIVRTAQAIFIHFDKYMIYERLQMACIPKSWNISDDVGQIEYIFSDKTGTLTQNVMEFKKCTINGVAYGEAYTEAQLGMKRREGINADEEAARARQKIAEDRVRMLQMLHEMHDNPYLRDEKLTFVAPDFVADLNGRSGPEQQKAVENFMLALALCHTVITEHTPGDPPQIEFKAQSPDEAALVATARDCGFTVLGRNGDDLIVNVMGQERTYTVLNTLEFNSTRKRMSAIVRMPDGTIRLFCKGADSIIYSRLARGQQQELRKTTAGHLEMFAQEGLRTLCVAERVLSEEEYRVWSESHDLAASALTDREQKLEEVASAIEQELMLLGGTAIEDRLQDGVPDTISLLADAGIKLWVLTGDKVETAINIGFSCNLLNNDMELIVFNVPPDKPEAAAVELENRLRTFGLTGSDEELIAARKDHKAPPPTHALVIDGDTLKFMLEDELKQKFLILCKQCKAVLCCRVSPAQKAAVVRMVKNGLNVMALSIGDGANDVAMIQEADVGVGIAGEEGRQAVMSSDYAIGQFRFLQRLVLVHGRWSYRRLGETTANFFYKVRRAPTLWGLTWKPANFHRTSSGLLPSSGMPFTTILMGPICSITRTSSWSTWRSRRCPLFSWAFLIRMWTTRSPLLSPNFTCVVSNGKNGPSSSSGAYNPVIHQRFLRQLTASRLYMFDGFYQSLMCFFMPYLLYAPGNFQTANGLGIDDRSRMGILVASAAVISSNTYILLNTYRWDWLTVLINAISSLLIFFWTGIYSSSPASLQFYEAAQEVYGSLSFWAVLLVTVVLCLLPRFVVKSAQKVFFPQDVDIIREQVTMGRFKYLDHFEAYVPPKAEAIVGGASGGSDMSAASSGLGKPMEPRVRRDPTMPEEERPFYPPSIAPTANTHNPRSQNGSNGTNYTGSLDLGNPRHQSWEHSRPSLDRKRSSVNSNDFAMGGMLGRVDSINAAPQSPHSPLRRPTDSPTNPV